jgi:hypothetical protein
MILNFDSAEFDSARELALQAICILLLTKQRLCN